MNMLAARGPAIVGTLNIQRHFEPKVTDIQESRRAFSFHYLLIPRTGLPENTMNERCSRLQEARAHLSPCWIQYRERLSASEGDLVLPCSPP